MKDVPGLFRSKIEDKSLKVAVVGLGYVGLPLAVEYASRGFSTLGIDLDKRKVDNVKESKNYIDDVDDSELAADIKSGKLTAE